MSNGTSMEISSIGRNSLASDLALDTASRDAATACKRKLMRITGALEVLDELLVSRVRTDVTSQLLKAEEENMRAHDELVEALEETDGGVVWAADCKSFFYVKLDDNHRPMQVWRHRLGTCLDLRLPEIHATR